MVSDVLTWESAIAQSIESDVNTRRFLETPLQLVINEARSGNLDAINYLLRQNSFRVMAKRSIKTCSQMHHRAKSCEGLFCDGAVASCVEVATLEIFGSSANLAEEPHRSVAMTLELDETHAAKIRERSLNPSKTGPCVLEYWDEKLKPSDKPSEVWIRQVTSRLKKPGWITDCRRKWNQTRGLPQRIDQATYFARGSTLTALGQALISEWNFWLENLEDSNPEALHLFLLPKFNSSDNDVLKTDIRNLVAWLGAIYDDACETWEVGNTADYHRILRNLQNKKIISTDLSPDEILLRSVEATCLFIEAQLTAAYESLSTEPTIVNALNRARELSRTIEFSHDVRTLDYVQDRNDAGTAGQR
jgi:hypothetical protein